MSGLTRSKINQLKGLRKAVKAKPKPPVVVWVKYKPQHVNGYPPEQLFTVRDHKGSMIQIAIEDKFTLQIFWTEVKKVEIATIVKRERKK